MIRALTTDARVGAALVAVVGVAVLLSIPVTLRKHFRERAPEPGRSVVSGEVVEVSPSARGFEATVEYRPDSRSASVRLQTDAGTRGWLYLRSRLQAGDGVLVAFDPARPSAAYVLSVQPLWSTLVTRLAVALVLLAGAGGVLLLGGRRTQSGRSQG